MNFPDCIRLDSWLDCVLCGSNERAYLRKAQNVVVTLDVHMVILEAIASILLFFKLAFLYRGRSVQAVLVKMAAVPESWYPSLRPASGYAF